MLSNPLHPQTVPNEEVLDKFNKELEKGECASKHTPFLLCIITNSSVLRQVTLMDGVLFLFRHAFRKTNLRFVCEKRNGHIAHHSTVRKCRRFSKAFIGTIPIRQLSVAKQYQLVNHTKLNGVSTQNCPFANHINAGCPNCGLQLAPHFLTNANQIASAG